jgi:hypothetical protein
MASDNRRAANWRELVVWRVGEPPGALNHLVLHYPPPLPPTASRSQSSLVVFSANVGRVTASGIPLHRTLLEAGTAAYLFNTCSAGDNTVSQLWRQVGTPGTDKFHFVWAYRPNAAGLACTTKCMAMRELPVSVGPTTSTVPVSYTTWHAPLCAIKIVFSLPPGCWGWSVSGFTAAVLKQAGYIVVDDAEAAAGPDQVVVWDEHLGSLPSSTYHADQVTVGDRCQVIAYVVPPSLDPELRHLPSCWRDAYGSFVNVRVHMPPGTRSRSHQQYPPESPPGSPGAAAVPPPHNPFSPSSSNGTGARTAPADAAMTDAAPSGIAAAGSDASHAPGADAVPGPCADGRQTAAPAPAQVLASAYDSGRTTQPSLAPTRGVAAAVDRGNVAVGHGNSAEPAAGAVRGPPFPAVVSPVTTAEDRLRRGFVEQQRAPIHEPVPAGTGIHAGVGAADDGAGAAARSGGQRGAAAAPIPHGTVPGAGASCGGDAHASTRAAAAKEAHTHQGVSSVAASPAVGNPCPGPMPTYAARDGAAKRRRSVTVAAAALQTGAGSTVGKKSFEALAGRILEDRLAAAMASVPATFRTYMVEQLKRDSFRERVQNAPPYPAVDPLLHVVRERLQLLIYQAENVEDTGVHRDLRRAICAVVKVFVHGSGADSFRVCQIADLLLQVSTHERLVEIIDDPGSASAQQSLRDAVDMAWLADHVPRRLRCWESGFFVDTDPAEWTWTLADGPPRASASRSGTPAESPRGAATSAGVVRPADASVDAREQRAAGMERGGVRMAPEAAGPAPANARGTSSRHDDAPAGAPHGAATSAGTVGPADASVGGLARQSPGTTAEAADPSPVGAHATSGHPAAPTVPPPLVPSAPTHTRTDRRRRNASPPACAATVDGRAPAARRRRTLGPVSNDAEPMALGSDSEPVHMDDEDEVRLPAPSPQMMDKTTSGRAGAATGTWEDSSLASNIRARLREEEYTKDIIDDAMRGVRAVDLRLWNTGRDVPADDYTVPQALFTHVRKLAHAALHDRDAATARAPPTWDDAPWQVSPSRPSPPSPGELQARLDRAHRQARPSSMGTPAGGRPN